MKNNLQDRKKRYYQLSTLLTYIDNKQLNSILDNSSKADNTENNCIIKIGKAKIFVKRIPLTDIEYEHMFSTENLYDLPNCYNYGVDSAGFGVFRELLTHIKTTNWGLEGITENFPFLYHYRIQPCPKKSSKIKTQKHRQYIKYWNSNKNIDEYMISRANAKHEVILFLEYIPYTLSSWLVKNPEKLDCIIHKMKNILNFLRKNGIIHFDIHFHNIITDGDQLYLTDFGLALDKQFTLSKKEQLFFNKNIYFDYGRFLFFLGMSISPIFTPACDKQGKSIKQKSLSKLKKYGIEDDKAWAQNFTILLDNIDDIYSKKLLTVDRNYIDIIIKYKEIIILIATFRESMIRNNEKDAKYNSRKLKQLLEKTGALIEPQECLISDL